MRASLSSSSLLGLLLVLAACGATDGFNPILDAGPGNDAGPPGCSVFIMFEPEMPIASPTTVVRANAGVLNAVGVIGYTWKVSFNGTQIGHMPAQADDSAITFPAVTPGIYTVRLDVASVSSCPTALAQLNVRAEGGNQSQERLHVVPPASATVPPLDKLISVLGGANFSLGTVSLESGMTASGAVRSGGTGVAAYLRFMPAAAPEAAVEVFTNASGGFSARVVNQPHDVLVIPTAGGFAPRLVKGWTPFQMVVNVGAGTTVTGTVRGPSGAALAGAKVQLKIGEVPSTVATTAANGSFSVLVEPDPGAVISVDVTPPAGSGLPRLAAQSQLFDLAQPFAVSYAASLTLRDLAGTVLRRQGAPIANGKLVVVGNLAGIGTVQAGATATAAGVVRVAATASAAGVLPSTLAPARALSAVVEVVANDHAVTAIDLTSAAPASIDAPPAVPISTTLRGPGTGGGAIENAFLDAVPAGALALAGVTSTIRGRSGPGGLVAASLAAGGRYDLRIHDPLGAHGAPLLVPDRGSATIPASYALRSALVVTGTLALSGNPTPVGGAAVQILCSLCTGLERSRPLAEGTSAPDGTFTLLVPDPGTN